LTEKKRSLAERKLQLELRKKKL